jgi:hypothetical protein
MKTRDSLGQLSYMYVVTHIHVRIDTALESRLNSACPAIRPGNAVQVAIANAYSARGGILSANRVWKDRSS